MYRLTNLTQDTTTTYKNKDLVYQALERENAKVKHLGVESYLLVEELDKKGVVLYLEEILLPFEGIADTLFLVKEPIGEETTAKENKFVLPFLKPSKDTKKQEPIPKEKEAPREALSTPKSETKSRPAFLSSLKKGLVLTLSAIALVFSLLLGALAVGLSMQQGKQVTALSQEVKDLSKLQDETGKLDTFIRYFIPRYFSEQANLDDFLAADLDLSHQSGQVQSVILETISAKGKDSYQLTYVLWIKEGETGSQKRVHFLVKQAPKSTYGYELVQKPIEAAYPK